MHCVRIALALAGVNERGDAGITPLIWAARRGHEVVELLLGREDVNLHFLDNSYDKTPLLWAAKNGTRQCEELGLHYGNNKVDCSDLA